MTLVYWALGFYVLFCLLVWLAQRWVMYPAPIESIEPRVKGATLLRLTGAEGKAVYALHFPASSGAPVVVHFHGNAEQLADQADLGDALNSRGLGFFAVEYPGYGLSRGQDTTESSCYAAADAALRYLRERFEVPRQRTVLQGQSLGSGVAVEMARRGYGAALVLITAFTSVADMASRLAPIVPARLLVRDRYDNAAKAPDIRLPVLLIHGTDDEVVPYSMGARLSRLFPHAELQTVQGAHHNDLFLIADRRLFDRIAEFARRSLR